MRALLLLLASFALASPVFAQGACGGAGQACCETGNACQGELGCSGGTCQDIVTDMRAYANYCKQELGFTNPRAKLPYMSCYDSGQVGSETRTETGRQAQLRLTLRDAAGPRTFLLRENGAPVQDGRDIWDLMLGGSGTPHGCDNPSYLYEKCDPYYRLNVWKPDAANPKIVAAIHCRGNGNEKPEPATAVLARAKLQAFQGLPSNTSQATQVKMFRQWNDSSEIVLLMSNLDTGKTCFFHAASPYYGSHFPAPDDESDISSSEGVRRAWEKLPVKPPQGPSDSNFRQEWLKNGRNAWQAPNFMSCTHCHDNGPFMHNAFIDSMNENGVAFLPTDRKSRPYLPLGFQKQGSVGQYFIKTDPVHTQTGVEAQLCTSCHSIGNSNGSGKWLDWVVGWELPREASAAARETEKLRRYMPPGGSSSREEYYEENGAHIDAIKCCSAHPDWRGCYKVPRETPTAQGTPGTGPGSCVASTCGGWNQPCCTGGAASCNHGGLTCSSGSCKFVDEVR